MNASQEKKRIAVIGGGAAGFFAAIHIAGDTDRAVTIFEAGRRTLDKVRISGGGRCNVTHACFDPAELIRNYPRGARALRGPFSHFGPRESIQWFQEHGVRLKTEADGRMFPTTDDSATIVDCLRETARARGVQIRLNTAVTAIHAQDDGGFQLITKDSFFDCVAVLIATGGAPGGLRLARALGHKIVDPVPSLFTFNLVDPRLKPLPGVAVQDVRLRLMGTKIESSGPLLVTHAGLSGPAVLRLSAFAAREMAAQQYRATLRVNWLPHSNEDQVRADFRAVKANHGARTVFNETGQIELPRRLWRTLATAAGIGDTMRWSQLPGAQLNRLIEELLRGEYKITGKSVFKEEFVTCGGVDLKQVDFRTMQSRLVPNLFFAGEVLDVDALTGGFNFQNAWTTGFIAGTHIDV